jgi:glycosyltransferase involved in cell wall biosynthesis
MTAVGQQPLVGIFTPVYNGEPYLEQCIESVLKQTYTNWEYVIVNNCSTDHSLDIAKKYAAREPRIRVHDNETFLSQLQNHNRALSLVSPSCAYYKMVQADDWIFPECLERMVQLAEENPTVGLVSSYQLAENRIMGEGLPFHSTVVSGYEICRLQLLEGFFFFGSPTAVLIRGEAVRNRVPFYDESMIHGDTDACYAVLRDWAFGFVHQVLTFYRTGNEGLSLSIRHLNPESLDKFIIILSHGKTFLERSEFDTTLRSFRRRYFRMLARGLFFPNGWVQFRYHQSGLKTVGYKLTLLKLFPHILYELADMILNPKKTGGELMEVLKRIFSGNGPFKKSHEAACAKSNPSTISGARHS